MTIFLTRFASFRDIILHFGEDHNLNVPAPSIANEFDSDGIPVLSKIVITIPPLLVVRRPDYTVQVSMTHNGQGRQGSTQVTEGFCLLQLPATILVATDSDLSQCFVFQYEDPNLVIVDYVSPRSTSVHGQTAVELGLTRVPARLGQLTNLRLQVFSVLEHR